jgi:hypothetical protein
LSHLLIHGPGAKIRAEEEGAKLGRVSHRFGEEGLKVADAREIVLFTIEPPFYPDGTLPVAIIGPMDDAQPKTQDVLLKSVEECTDVGLVLWARDAGSIAPTIRSRCLTYWAPLAERGIPSLGEAGKELLEYWVAGHFAEAIQVAISHSKEIPELLEALCYLVARNWADYGHLWIRLRKVVRYWNPTLLSLVGAMVEND